MNIYLNGRFLTQSVTGVQRYAIEVVKMFDHLIEKENAFSGYHFILLMPKNIKYSLALNCIKQKKVGHLKGHLWEQLELPSYSRDGFLINLCNTASILKQNQIVTIHDAAVFALPDAFSFLFRSWYKFLFKILGKKLKYIITDSAFSKEELSKFCDIKPEKIQVIYLGIEHILRVEHTDSILDKYELLDKNFVFAVSSMNPNKNFKAVVRAAELQPENIFVIAGGTNPKVFSTNPLELPKNVKYIGYITDEELVDLYRHAGCFVYPSLYEGFGLPPLEAMAHGCPVVVSESASLPEICGDAVIYCDPHSSEDILQKINLVLEDKEIGKMFSIRGIEHVKNFSWEKCAKRLMAIVEMNLKY